MNITKIGKRYFYTKTGKEWEFEKHLDMITTEGQNKIRLVVIPELPAMIFLNKNTTDEQYQEFIRQVKQSKSGKCVIIDNGV